jgi:two-component system, OmpR family, phosphate regulon response regulator PhoB
MARVLVVDDDSDINLALRSALEIAGYQAEGADNGAAALAACDRSSPDLVLLDQMLPDVDGMEVCRRLRTTPATGRVPIVFLTARADEATRLRGLALGADDYIVKPFSTQELLLRIRSILRRAQLFELGLSALWVRQRDQFHVWNGYAELHLARGEWRDCLEVSGTILRNCGQALTSAERSRLFERVSICSRRLEDGDAGDGPAYDPAAITRR